MDRAKENLHFIPITYQLEKDSKDIKEQTNCIDKTAMQRKSEKEVKDKLQHLYFKKRELMRKKSIKRCPEPKNSDENANLLQECFDRRLNRIDRLDVGLFVIAIIFNVSLKTLQLWFGENRLYPMFMEALRLFVSEDCRTEVRSLLSEVVLLLNLCKESRNLLMTVVRAVLFITTISLTLLSSRKKIQWRARKRIKYNRIIFVCCLIGSLFAIEGILRYLWVFRFEFFRSTSELVSCPSLTQQETFNQLKLLKKIALSIEFSLILSLIFELILCFINIYRTYLNHRIFKSFYRWHSRISYRRFCKWFRTRKHPSMIRKRLKKIYIRIPVRKRLQTRRRPKKIDKRKLQLTALQRRERHKMKKLARFRQLRKDILGRSFPKDYEIDKDILWSSKNFRMRHKKRLIKAKIRRNLKGYRYLKHRRKHEKRLNMKYEPCCLFRCCKWGLLRILYKSKLGKLVRYSFRKNKFLLRKRLTPLRRQLRRLRYYCKNCILRCCLPCFVCYNIFLRHTVVRSVLKPLQCYFQRLFKHLRRIKRRFLSLIYKWLQKFPIFEKLSCRFRKLSYKRRPKRVRRRLKDCYSVRRHPHFKRVKKIMIKSEREKRKSEYL